MYVAQLEMNFYTVYNKILTQMKPFHLLILSALIALCTGCVYPFEAKNVKEIEGLIVIEGDIIANGATIVRLSRTIGLSEQEESIQTVNDASVLVESSTGLIYPAVETSPGIYEADTDGLDLTARYRLYVATNDNMVYASDFVPVVISPSVSVDYKVFQWDKHINIYVSTRDPNTKTQYFRWTYEQNWEITSTFMATHTYDPSTGQYIQFTEFPPPYYYCWNEQSSTAILLDRTDKLSINTINDRRLLTIYEGDPRISHLYCIQVTQRALTAEAYAYWNTLLRNSQGLGGIFAPMPNELRGNISCLSNPEVPALGYINATTLTYSNRLFIERHFPLRNDYICINSLETYPYNFNATYTMDYFNNLFTSYRPVYEVNNRQSIVWAPRRCVDCTFGGTKNKPSWWPNNHR